MNKQDIEYREYLKSKAETIQRNRIDVQHEKILKGFSFRCEYLIACLAQRTCEIGEFSPNYITLEEK